MLRIGLAGLGQMGRAVARRIMVAEYPLALYNRTASRLEPFISDGAGRAETPRELAEGRDVVLTLLSDDDAFAAVLEGPDGIAAGIEKGALLIEMSTLTPGAIKSAAGLLGERGAEMLHAPILGGPKQVFVGSATITAGGPKEAFDRARLLLEAISRPVHHVGPIENGTLTKMALNIMLAHLGMGTASMLAFAKLAGIDQNLVLRTMFRYASEAVNAMGLKMISRDESVSFYLRNLEKDMRYFLQTADEFGLELPTIAATRELLAEAVEDGAGDEDWTAIYQRMLG